jgi:hypothetical protein
VTSYQTVSFAGGHSESRVFVIDLKPAGPLEDFLTGLGQKDLVTVELGCTYRRQVTLRRSEDMQKRANAKVFLVLEGLKNGEAEYILSQGRDVRGVLFPR